MIIPTCPSEYSSGVAAPSSRQVAKVDEGQSGVPSLGIRLTSGIGHLATLSPDSLDIDGLLHFFSLLSKLFRHIPAK